jgi:ABC-type glycerol-3-phosphate transport system substrate-binding protein
MDMGCSRRFARKSPRDAGSKTAYSIKMHADTFGILKGSKNPNAAFEVLTYMLSPEVAPKLLNIYGGMPARLSLQGDYFRSTAKPTSRAKTSTGMWL